MCHLKITLLNYADYELAAAESWLSQDYKGKKICWNTYQQLEWIMETSKEWLYLGQVCPQTAYYKCAPLKLCAQSWIWYYCQHTHLSGYKVSNSHNLVCSSRKRHWESYLSLQYDCKNLSVTVHFHAALFNHALEFGFIWCFCSYFCKALENAWEITFQINLITKTKC